MGAFRDQLVALGVQKFWDGSDTTYNSGGGFWYSNSVIGSGSIRLSTLSPRASLVKTETSVGLDSTFFIPDVRSIWDMSSSPADVGTLVLTGIFAGVGFIVTLMMVALVGLGKKPSEEDIEARKDLQQPDDEGRDWH